MSQTFSTPDGSTAVDVAIKTTIPNALEALRTVFSGGSAPTSAVTYQLWADTSSGVLRQYNGTTWDIIGPLLANGALQSVFIGEGSSLAAAKTMFLPPTQSKVILLGVSIVSDTTTLTSVTSSKEFLFDLYNVTDAESLFSAVPTTATTQSGIGGGEITLDTEYPLLADQNTVIDAGDILELRVTVNGSPTTLARCSFFAHFYARAT